MLFVALPVLRALNLLTGLALGVVATYQLLAGAGIGPAILFAGVLVVGPVEDWLMDRLGEPQRPQGTCAELIDLATSWVLLLCCVAAAVLA